MPSEATISIPEATEAKPESHRGQEHTNASRMDHSNATLTMKLQQAQVHDSDQHSSNSNINDNTICSNDNGTDNGACSMQDNSLSTNGLNSDTSNCYCMFNPGGDRPNNKHRGTSTCEDSDSTNFNDNNNTRLCNNGNTASNVTGSGRLSCLVWDCNDNTCSSSRSNSSPPSACATYGFDSINSNLAFDPGGSQFSNNSICSEHNTISSMDTSSLSSNTLTYNGGGSSDNSNNSGFVHDPGSTSFSSTLNTSDAATTSNHGNHIFDPGSSSINSYIDSTPFSPDLDFSVACFPPCTTHSVEQAPPSKCVLAAFMPSDITSLLSANNASTIQFS
jgi:hypothetical protein